MELKWRSRRGTAVAVALGCSVALLPMLVQPRPASGAEAPETRLITYTWSHTAHLATFNFDAPGSVGATFECSLTGPGEASAWSACVSPRQYDELTPRVYEFRVRARAGDGTADPTPAARRFNIGVDTVWPETSLSDIVAPTTARTATFGFASSEGGTFECRRRHSGRLLGDWAPCTTPVRLADLPDGTHQFEVRAVDLAGEYDRTPASYTWLLDATPPDTTMSVGDLDGRAASFSFAGGTTHECRLVGPGRVAVWTLCRSPQKYEALADGRYTFAVRALDRHGNADRTPSVHTWVVSTGLRMLVRPRVEGAARPGRMLRATPGRWAPTPTSVRYQWLRDGRPIRSARSRGYRVRPADRGDRLSVKVSVTRAGHPKATAVSASRRVR
ncbi:hypothetical protein [Nocardioides sambongensis]|uniref:hypothetical protein n=1 Tax=Nocardioides sambongensis TaxID=2589074 RepID=UPI00112D1055|nr:hypothetical protein [Nocardioides sambongensis]